jgi:hypothetical protein
MDHEAATGLTRMIQNVGEVCGQIAPVILSRRSAAKDPPLESVHRPHPGALPGIMVARSDDARSQDDKFLAIRRRN